MTATDTSPRKSPRHLPATHRGWTRRAYLTALSAGLMPGVVNAQAHSLRHSVKLNLPDVTYRLVVGTSAGDSMDHAARLLARYLGSATNRAFVVDNKPGANGLLAAEFVAKTRSSSAINIYVGMASQMLVNQLLHAKLPLDLRTDLQRLYMLSIGSHYLSVNPEKTPVKTLSELVAYMKANPGKLSHGSSGLGSYTHLMGVRLNQLLGADLALIPYKGEAPTVMALLSGELDMGWVSAASIKLHPGKLLPLAGNGSERMASVFPDVPTFAEAGIPDEAFALQGWIGTAVAAHTPPDVKEALGHAIHRVMNAPGLPEQYASLGIPTVPDDSPAKFEAFYQRIYPQWERLIKTVGVRIE